MVRSEGAGFFDTLRGTTFNFQFEAVGASAVLASGCGVAIGGGLAGGRSDSPCDVSVPNGVSAEGATISPAGWPPFCWSTSTLGLTTGGASRGAPSASLLRSAAGAVSFSGAASSAWASSLRSSGVVGFPRSASARPSEVAGFFGATSGVGGSSTESRPDFKAGGLAGASALRCPHGNKLWIHCGTRLCAVFASSLRARRSASVDKLGLRAGGGTTLGGLGPPVCFATPSGADAAAAALGVVGCAGCFSGDDPEAARGCVFSGLDFDLDLRVLSRNILAKTFMFPTKIEPPSCCPGLSSTLDSNVGFTAAAGGASSLLRFVPPSSGSATGSFRASATSCGASACCAWPPPWDLNIDTRDVAPAGGSSGTPPASGDDAASDVGSWICEGVANCARPLPGGQRTPGSPPQATAATAAQRSRMGNPERIARPRRGPPAARTRKRPAAHDAGGAGMAGG